MWVSGLNGGWRGSAAGTGDFGTNCPEVRTYKNARTARRYADARNNIFTIVLSDFTLKTRRSRRGSYAFFSWCRLWVLWKRKMNTTLPPGNRRVLKNGRLYHAPRIPAFQKGKRQLKCDIQPPLHLKAQDRCHLATVLCLGCCFQKRAKEPITAAHGCRLSALRLCVWLCDN